MKSETNPAQEGKVLVSIASERAEVIGGVLIAFFAALMAISDLVSSNIEEEMQKAQNKNNAYFSWYQSKSVKQSLQESHLGTIEALLKTGLIKPEKEAALLEEIANTKTEIKRYKMEKKEIMDGSAHLPPSEWVQDLDGEMGAIVGIKEWEQLEEKLDGATNKFDIAMLFYQVSLVLGAVCIVIYDSPRMQQAFIFAMIITGFIGIMMSCLGYFAGI